MSSSLRRDDATYALVCVRTGQLLETLDGAEAKSAVHDFAAAAGELFSEAHAADLERLFLRVGSERRGASFAEIAVVSPRGRYVVRPLGDEAGTALLAHSQGEGRLGLLLSEVHTRTEQRLGERS